MGYWKSSQKPLVIYHGNCADGFTAAWAIWKRFGDEAEYFPGVYQQPPPDTKGRDVILVDFSYKREVLREMSVMARSILVLDHHKSAAEDLYHGADMTNGWCCVDRQDRPEVKGAVTWERIQGNVAQDQSENVGQAVIYALFDMNRSGAGLAWDFFHPDTPRPALVNYVEDRDLWRFALPGTREIQAAVFSYPYEFGIWEMLARSDMNALRDAGAAIERKHHKDIAELVKVCQRRMTIAGRDVPVASLPYTLTSDAGHLMAHGEPFAACYWDTPDKRVFSLRSTDEGEDVSAVAQAFGGGGHARAAGFAVPRDHELATA